MADTRINLTENGQGSPLVLVHGFPLDGRMWDGMTERLSTRHRVLVPDLPGFGRSIPAVPFSMDSVADDLFDRLTALDAIPCVLAGLSMGGYIALSFALHHAAALRGLILLDTRAEADTPQGRAARNELIELARSAGSAAIAERMYPRLLAPETPARKPAVAASLRKIMESCSPQAIENALIAMRDRPDRTGDLPSIETPTLIIVGEADVITPPATAEEMSKRIPNSTLRVIPDAGHMTPMEQPEEVATVMVEWLNRGMGVPPM